jgi:hypothetical protein
MGAIFLSKAPALAKYPWARPLLNEQETKNAGFIMCQTSSEDDPELP